MFAVCTCYEFTPRTGLSGFYKRALCFCGEGALRERHVLVSVRGWRPAGVYVCMWGKIIHPHTLIALPHNERPQGKSLDSHVPYYIHLCRSPPVMALGVLVAAAFNVASMTPPGQDNAGYK